MALEFDGTGVVILPPVEKESKQGNPYLELVVDFGINKRDDWYVRCFVTGLNDQIAGLEKGNQVNFSGIIIKWQMGGAFAVVLQADSFSLL